jgi:hypothetical protein
VLRLQVVPLASEHVRAPTVDPGDDGKDAVRSARLHGLAPTPAVARSAAGCAAGCARHRGRPRAALVPPFNRFDAAQWPALAGRYDVIAGGPESVVLTGFHGGPQWRGAAIYPPGYAPLYATAAVVLEAVEVMIEERVVGWIPVVLHMGWEIDDNNAALRRLARRLAPYAASWEDLLASADASRQA